MKLIADRNYRMPLVPSNMNSNKKMPRGLKAESLHHFDPGDLIDRNPWARF